MEDYVEEMPEKYIDDGNEEMPEEMQKSYEPLLPQFTYKFDKPNLENKSPFAVAPNDPRFYQDSSFATGKYIFLSYI